jgi:MoaA/NifB/PqqE/SkfB family radical SAM enzyme
VKPYAARKLLNRLTLAADLRRKRMRFYANPTQLVIEPTNRCNAACPICARNFWDKSQNPPTDLEADTLKRLEEFLVTADTVFAFGHGEPTIAPLFWPVIEAAKKRGCRVEVTTNGLTLDEPLVERLVQSGVEILNISLDAVEPDALRARRSLDLAKIERALTFLAARKHAAGARDPEAGIAVVVDRDNLDELPGIFAFARDLRVKTILVNHLVAWDASLHQRSAYHEPERFRRAFADLQRRAEGSGVAIVLPFEAVERGVCPHPLRMFFVRAGGEVWPCCNAVFRNDRYSFPAGNVHFASLRAIWNGEPYRVLRRAFLRGEPPPPHCQICPLLNDELPSHLRDLSGLDNAITR